MRQADRQFGWPHGSQAGPSVADADSAVSPCIRRCTLDEHDLCVGCGRTLGEILEWAAASTDRKSEIRSAAVSRLEQRRIRF